MAQIRAAYLQKARGLRLLATVGARELHIGSPRFDRAVTDTAVALSEEAVQLLEELDSVTLELKESGQALQVELQAELGGNESFVARSLLDWHGQSAAAPQLFWDLPREVESASFQVSLPEERLEKTHRLLRDLLRGAGEKDKLPRKAAERLERVLGELAGDYGVLVSASGPSRAVAQGERQVLLPEYGIVYVKRPLSALKGLLGELASLLSDPEVAARLPEGTSLPQLQATRTRLKGEAQALVYEWSTPDAQWSPLLHQLAEGQSAETEGGTPVKGVLACVPRGDFTLVLWAREVEGLEKALAHLSDPASPRLSSVAELAPFKSEKVVSGGLLRPALVLSSLSAFLPEELTSRHEAVLRSTPHGGEAPLLVETRTSARGRGVSLHLSMKASRASLEDLVSLYRQVTREGGLRLPTSPVGAAGGQSTSP